MPPHLVWPGHVALMALLSIGLRLNCTIPEHSLRQQSSRRVASFEHHTGHLKVAQPG